MDIQSKIDKAQHYLQQHGVDGWLLYAFEGVNSIALDFMDIAKERLLTRRLLYWIPKTGEPVCIVHAIETHLAHHLPGKKLVYTGRHTLHTYLEKVLHAANSVAMEYSPECSVPNVSKVDAGTVEVIRSFGVEVVSSAPFLQYVSCTLNDAQYVLHKEAAQVVEGALSEAFRFIETSLREGQTITEFDVQQRILAYFARCDCVPEGGPLCAVGANTADPHYEPSETTAATICKGDIILIDLWCKKNVPDGVFADVTQMGYAGKQPPAKARELLAIVAASRDEAIAFVTMRAKKGEIVKGFEVDEIAREYIKEKGYAHAFLHRLGHNIFTENHGPGANLDSLETLDERPLLPNTCFSVEPGIYLPGELGVRLELDIFMREDGTIERTTPLQEDFVLLDVD